MGAIITALRFVKYAPLILRLLPTVIQLIDQIMTGIDTLHQNPLVNQLKKVELKKAIKEKNLATLAKCVKEHC